MRFLPYALAILFTLGACTNDTSDGSGDEESLTADVLPIFQQRCAGCHTRTDPPFPEPVANSVYFERAEDILGLVGTFIIAGDSDMSGIVAVMRREQAVGVGPTLMPPPMQADAVPATAVDVVARWIDQGAMDN